MTKKTTTALAACGETKAEKNLTPELRSDPLLVKERVQIIGTEESPSQLFELFFLPSP